MLWCDGKRCKHRHNLIYPDVSRHFQRHRRLLLLLLLLLLPPYDPGGYCFRLHLEALALAPCAPRMRWAGALFEPEPLHAPRSTLPR